MEDSGHLLGIWVNFWFESDMIVRLLSKDSRGIFLYGTFTPFIIDRKWLSHLMGHVPTPDELGRY